MSLAMAGLQGEEMDIYRRLVRRKALLAELDED